MPDFADGLSPPTKRRRASPPKRSLIWNAADFREAVLRAVNLGDDADTTGAVCGQLAGAYWGESGLPAEWRQSLARRDMILGYLDALLAAESRDQS